MKPCWCGPLIYHIHVCWEGHVPNVSLRSMFKLRRVCPPWILSPSVGRKSISQKNLQWSFSTSLAKRFQMQAVPNKHPSMFSQMKEVTHSFIFRFCNAPAYSCPKVEKSTQKLWRLLCIFQIYVKRTMQFSIISYDHMIHNFDIFWCNLREDRLGKVQELTNRSLFCHGSSSVGPFECPPLACLLNTPRRFCLVERSTIHFCQKDFVTDIGEVYLSPRSHFQVWSLAHEIYRASKLGASIDQHRDFIRSNPKKAHVLGCQWLLSQVIHRRETEKQMFSSEMVGSSLDSHWAEAAGLWGRDLVEAAAA